MVGFGLAYACCVLVAVGDTSATFRCLVVGCWFGGCLWITSYDLCFNSVVIEL